MADLVKMFRKNDPGGIGPDETIHAITMVLPRASIVGAPSNPGIGGVIERVAGDVVRGRMADRALAAEGEVAGDAASWPERDTVSIVLTDRRLVLYDAVKGARKLQGPIGEFPLDRIAGMTFEKKTIMNVARLAFADGSVRAFDSAKGAGLEAFADALARTKGA